MNNNCSTKLQHKEFSDYIVYVDESGDHSLKNVNKEYPLFVLAFCIFNKEEYLNLIKEITKLKFKYFGHDKVVFHENDIRRKNGDFKIFNTQTQETFMREYWEIINKAKFTIIATVIKKLLLKEKYIIPDNPYNLSMKFCLERLNYFLKEHDENNNTTHVIVEQRGKNEDKDLELEFRRICQTQEFNFKLRMANKQSNCVGLQLTDLIVRPIGSKILRPEQSNRGFAIIETKFEKIKGNYMGHGLKIFPEEK
ncbi:MAG: hypothetical protein QG673_1444 [Pseudomonadota bacterium]|nr:hypothetical protein [Pseudomonadota bacterium]